MSGDWFEEALEDIDEDADGEPVDRDPDESSIKDAFDVDSDTDADAATDSEDETGHTAADAPASPDEFDADTDRSEATGSVDPFGFDADDADRSTETDDTDRSGEPADPDADSTDPFGFGSGNGDDAGPAGNGAGEGDRPEPSPAQSAEEFGFSLDDGASTDGSTVDAPTTDTPTADTPTTDAPTADTPTTDAPTTDTPTTDAPTPESDGPAAGGSTPDAVSEPGADTGGADDPFGFGTSASQSVGGGGDQPDDDFGFGGFGGGGGGGGPAPEEFDDEEFDSDIDRIDLGIDGLDEMILGGVPERSLIGIIGGAGTGKTTFGLQFLNEALENGERAVFITLEQTEEAVLSTAEEKGWPFREYADSGQLAVVVLDPVEMANSLASIRGDISRLIREFGASRLVLDSVSLLEMMYDHPAKRRSEIFDFTRSLKDAGVTTLLTSEASEDSSHASRYGAVEYLTDAVFVLRYVRTSNFEETRLAIEIQKIRDANHSRATKPYDLTDEGMSVHRQANIF
ncbi:KaiC domain-containing protein [Halohasta salina]|uniref:KaiC domain-containing protein n=1 Tax=Halohasta salina TaxID=2961621 RepID=UPI0020A384F2|nr:KaiC domain-containing protein [Halohasta salina]